MGLRAEIYTWPYTGEYILSLLQDHQTLSYSLRPLSTGVNQSTPYSPGVPLSWAFDNFSPTPATACPSRSSGCPGSSGSVVEQKSDAGSVTPKVDL